MNIHDGKGSWVPKKWEKNYILTENLLYRLKTLFQRFLMLKLYISIYPAKEQNSVMVNVLKF